MIEHGKHWKLLTDKPDAFSPSISLAMYQDERLQTKRAELQLFLSRCDQKIAILRQAADIETDVLRKFQYQQQLLQEEQRRTAIEEEIFQIIARAETATSIAHSAKTYLVDTPPFVDDGASATRSHEIKALYTLLTRPHASGVLMTGLSGIGKTTLAALVYHYVEHLRFSDKRFFTDQSIWLKMEPTTTLVDIVDALYRALNRTLPASSHNAAPSLLSNELFRLLNTLEQPRLIVLDQFEELLDVRTGLVRNAQDGIAALFQFLVHRHCRCRFLLVSRFAPWGLPAYPPLYLPTFEIPPLQIHEGVALLRLWGVQGLRDELEEAVAYCQGHAQALLVLRSMLTLDSTISLSALSREAAQRQRWIGKAAHEFLAYCYIHQLGRNQNLLLRSFSLYRNPIPENAVLEMLRQEDQALGAPISSSRRSTIDELLSLKLLSSQISRYTVPSVVAESIRLCFQQEDAPSFQQAHACAAHYYLQLARGKSHLKRQRKNMDDISELIEAVWHLCQAQSYEQAYNLWRDEQLFITLYRWGESAVLREIYQQFLNWEEGLTATIYNELGDIAAMQGQMAEAQRYFTHALSLCSDESSGEEQIILLSNIGDMCSKLKQWDEAQSQYQEALRICDEKSIATGMKGVVLNNLGNLLYEKNRQGQETDQADVIAEYALAISYYEQALSLYQRFDVPDEIVRTLNNLGRVYSICQRKAEAQSTYLQALSLSQRTGERRIEAASLANLGLLCSEQADLEHAQIYYKQALLIFHQFGNSWEEAELLRNLGTLFLLRQHYDVGLASFILARDIFHALECPEQGKIPAWVEAELRLALKQGNYEEWFQEIERNPIPLLERTLYSTVQ
jgi:tetratricopeptide (TPR) repeat protein